MGAAVATVTALPNSGSQTQSGKLSNAHPGPSAGDFRDGVYHALRKALELYPEGIDQFAEDNGASRSDTYARVGRKEDSKTGCLQRAFLDYLGPLFAHRPSALRFMAELCILLELEPPVSRHQATDEEVGRAWMASVGRMPEPYRSAAIADMAQQLGIRIEDIKL
jgi:hypothetical protein